MRTLLLASLVTLATATLSGTATAADEKFYLRGNIGSTDLDAGPLFDNSDTAYGINFGWRFLPWLAVEAGYNRLGEFEYDCGGQVCPAVVLPPIELDSTELGLAGRVPFGDSGFFGQARLGFHRWDAGFGGHETDPYYGVGVGYQFNDRFNLSLNFDRYETESLDLDRTGLGLEVSF
jgi:hypothetical protein